MKIMDAIERRMGGCLQWGVSDCSSSACSVFDDLHGVDPLAPIRGKFNGPISAARLVRMAGGMELLASRLALRAGLRECAPCPGAIGLVPNGDGVATAICIAPDLWAVKAPRGFGVVKKVLIAWSI